MSRGEEVLLSIQSIHDAVLLPDGWSRALARIAQAARSEHACLLLQNGMSAPALIGGYRMTPDEMAGFAQMARARNPYWENVSEIPQGAAVLGTQFISDRDFMRCEFYNAAIRPIGAFYGMVAKPLKTREIDATLAVGRRRGRDDFSIEDMAVARTVLPHIASALKAKTALAQANRQVRAASHAFDAMNVAVILVDAGARIVFANGRAEAFLSRDKALTADGVHVGGADTPTQRRLRRAIAQCAGMEPPWAAVAPVEIAADGGTSLQVTCTPLGRSTIDLHDSPLGLAEPVALLLIHDHAQQRQAMRQRLTARFGLTMAEAGVVMEVIEGGGREDVARRLGVSVATVRTHLMRIFQKTGVRRQAELVRLALNGDAQLR
jgi:DNA-binding CsgD family transcriptional regulator/PAS domain-containing protein